MQEKVADRRRKRQEINDQSTIAIIEKLNLKEGMHCLEIGAGLGSIAIYLSEVVGQNGLVDAIDIKLENLDYIDKIKSDNVNTYLIDITGEDTLHKKYDFIHARFVFEHIQNCAQEIKNVVEKYLKEDGIIMIEDAVYDGIDFIGSTDYKKVMRNYANSIENYGSDYSWGLKMHQVFKQIGLKDVMSFGDIRVIQGGTKEAEFWKLNLEEMKDEIVKIGNSEESIQQAISDLSNEEQWFSGPIIMVACGTK